MINCSAILNTFTIRISRRFSSTREFQMGNFQKYWSQNVGRDFIVLDFFVGGRSCGRKRWLREINVSRIHTVSTSNITEFYFTEVTKLIIKQIYIIQKWEPNCPFPLSNHQIHNVTHNFFQLKKNQALCG
jgi:hypothetical protein